LLSAGTLVDWLAGEKVEVAQLEGCVSTEEAVVADEFAGAVFD
jgi:hypothetical protein